LNFFHISRVRLTSYLPIVSIPAHSARTVGLRDVKSHRRTTRANEKEWQGQRFGKETEERGSLLQTFCRPDLERLEPNHTPLFGQGEDSKPKVSLRAFCIPAVSRSVSLIRASFLVSIQQKLPRTSETKRTEKTHDVEDERVKELKAIVTACGVRKQW
jgi:hypothetical protein